VACIAPSRRATNSECQVFFPASKPYSSAGFCTSMRLRVRSSGAHRNSRSTASHRLACWFHSGAASCFPIPALGLRFDVCLRDPRDVGAARRAVHGVVVGNRQLHPRVALVEQPADDGVDRMTQPRRLRHVSHVVKHDCRRQAIPQRFVRHDLLGNSSRRASGMSRPPGVASGNRTAS
jgi:hypothetical protein